MGDIRFKISGSSEPFIAQLYCGTSLIQQKAIDYSGTTCNSCNIIGNLFPGSSYSLKITDNIGNSICTGFTTPVQVGTTTLATKTIGLAGVADNTTIAYNSYLTNYLTISPSLSGGESLTLNFSACTLGGGTSGVNSSVSISTCQNGGSWVSKFNVSNAGSTTTIPPIILYSGDKLCYNLNVIRSAPLSHGQPTTNLCGCAVLNLKTASGSGFNLGTCSPNQLCTSICVPTTTTTSTTTLPPITVYLGGVLNQSTISSNKCICGKICTSPPLVAGQSFRLCFTTSTRSSTFTGTVKPVSACAYLLRSATCVNFASTRLLGGEICTRTDGGYCYVDVNSSNISTISLCIKALSTQVNDSSVFINCTNLSLNTISNTSGGNFILSPNQCMCAQSISGLGGGGGGEFILEAAPEV